MIDVLGNFKLVHVWVYICLDSSDLPALKEVMKLMIY